VRRNRLGNRMIAAVGMLVAAAVAALLGFSVLVAKRVDQASAVREVELARRQLDELPFKVRLEMAVLTHWDQNLDPTTRYFDRDWVHRHYGKRLHSDRGHDRSFIIGPSGDPVYSSADGMDVGADLYRRMQRRIDPLIERVHRAHAAEIAANATYGEMGELEAPMRRKFEGAFRRIDGRPAVVGVATIVPGGGRNPSSSVAPPVAVSVAFLDRDMLQAIANEIAADVVAVHDGDLPESELAEGKVAAEIPLAPDETKAWLVWSPRAPGAGMLVQLLPALFGVVALLAFITMIVLLYVRRTTERLDQSERRATELAYHDRLTGLANRVHLLDTLAERLGKGNVQQRFALVLIDLDDFKNINDTLGHATGDEVLFAVGERLSRCAGEDGMAVRLGADEFAVLAQLKQGKDSVIEICGRVLACMHASVLAGGQVLEVGATIGVAIAPDDADDGEQLLRRADIALYRAKAECRGGYRLFDMSYEEILHKRSAIERDLSQALAQEQLTVKYQPQYAADGERIVGVEALVRWDHPERGVVPPSEFIPVAEHSGLVVKLDEWVLRRACETAAKWPGLSLAVNLSASNFRQGNVVERLTRVLADTGFDARRLEIEITESMLLGATGEVLGELSELRRLGIRIALDDFGTGYSSLGYLRRFPVDKLKIDKSFVQNLGITEDAAAIVECVTRLGRALGLAVTAEGVETGEQHRFIRAVGCHQVQGYLFSPPLEPEQMNELMRPQSGRARRSEPRLVTA
jgi:diguanylate cyclase (GGDEF)-like protein